MKQEQLKQSLSAIAQNGRWHSRQVHDLCLIYSNHGAFVQPIERVKSKCPNPDQHFELVQEKQHGTKTRYSYLLTAYAWFLVFQEIGKIKPSKIQKAALAFFQEYQKQSVELAPLEEEADSEEDEFDYKEQFDFWLQQEEDGVQFPVDFEIGWPMAGYSRKDKAKARLTNENSGLIQGRDYIIKKGSFHQTVEFGNDGRSSDSLFLTTNAFKDFCQQARTAQGKVIRQYFIAVENEWRKIKKIANSKDNSNSLSPELQSRIALVEAERDKAVAELNGQKAIAEVQRDTALAEKDKALTELEIQKVMFDSANLKDHYETNVETCRRLGFLHPNGKPDFFKLNLLMERFATREVFRMAQQINKEFPRD